MSDNTGSSGRTSLVLERSYRASIEDVWALWTTKEGFESWWGPQGFRVEVHALEARVGGALHYDMIADAPEMIAAMQKSGQPIKHAVRARFSRLEAPHRVGITSVIDFLPGVAAYENTILVDLYEEGERVRMVTHLETMHSEDFSRMQKQGYESQLTKLDARFA
ncbi:MAG: SRPBCC domain-containing protein [Labilithrix sp.]|nr:SRPBCC domain-containing protein [Labilithrix sp.]MBX3219135.1 SRPBCC domain-containing protein [Labilithrix sp.]